MKNILKISTVFLVFAALLIFSSKSLAQTHPDFTYDVGAASGSYDGNSYSEINLGLNWYFLDDLAWRNSVFTRFGDNVDSATGLDSSLRYSYNTDTHATFGMGFFGGGGYRFTKSQDSGPFAEGGLTFRVGGLSVGAGVKEIYYPSPGKDSTGGKLADHDTTVFLILAGGGVF